MTEQTCRIEYVILRVQVGNSKLFAKCTEAVLWLIRGVFVAQGGQELLTATSVYRNHSSLTF